MTRFRSSIRIASLVSLAAACGILGGAGRPGGGSTPPPNPAITFQSNGSIYVMNADGTNLRLVLAGASTSADLEPVWSANSAEIVFGGNPGGAPNGIWSVRPDGTGLRLITATARASVKLACSPAPAPDGNFKIAWIDSAVGDPTYLEVFAINLDGTGAQQVTATPGLHEFWVSWSPEASRLAVTTLTVFSGGSREDCHVYTLGSAVSGGIEVSGAQNLTAIAGSPLNGAKLAHCDWARTSDRIVVSALGSVGGSSYDLWVLSPATPAAPARVPVSGNTVNERMGSWSPDDSTLVFWYAGRKSGIYTVRPDGTGLRQLTSGGIAPDWKRTVP